MSNEIMKPRTSKKYPLQIASLETSVGGRIGMTFCPGKCDNMAMTGPWERDLNADLNVIAKWGAIALVTLMEDHELVHLGVPDIGEKAESMGLTWYHMPITDVSIPDPLFERAWETQGFALREKLREGKGVVVHCRGGLGRTGIIAAHLLIELGELPEVALQRVREMRPGAVETPEQEEYVLRRVHSLA